MNRITGLLHKESLKTKELKTLEDYYVHHPKTLIGSEDAPTEFLQNLVRLLNDPNENAQVKERSLHILEILSRLPENRAQLLDILQNWNESFEDFLTDQGDLEMLFDGSADRIFNHTLQILFRVSEFNFEARQLLEMTGGVKLSLAAVNAVLQSAVVPAPEPRRQWKIRGEASPPVPAEPSATASLCPSIEMGRIVQTALRLLLQLTSPQAYFPAVQCETLSALRELTQMFRLRIDALLEEFLARPVLLAMRARLGELLSALEMQQLLDDVNTPTSPPQDETAPLSLGAQLTQLVHDTFGPTLQLLHGLLTFCTQRSAQLRKHIVDVDMIPAIALPYLDLCLTHLNQPALSHTRMASAINGVKLALRTLCIATLRVKKYRQMLLNSDIPPRVLGFEPLANSPQILCLLAKLCINIGICGDSQPASRRQQRRRRGRNAAIRVQAETSTEISAMASDTIDAMQQSFAQLSHVQIASLRSLLNDDSTLPVFKDTPTYKALAFLFQDEATSASQSAPTQTQPTQAPPQPTPTPTPTPQPTQTPTPTSTPQPDNPPDVDNQPDIDNPAEEESDDDDDLYFFSPPAFLETQAPQVHTQAHAHADTHTHTHTSATAMLPMKDTPTEFVCELSGVVMSQPVRVFTNHVYERGSLLAYLNARGRRCPVTKQPITTWNGEADNEEVRADPELAQRIHLWKMNQIVKGALVRQ